MSKKCGIGLVIAGIVLILSALSLFVYNRCENAQAGRESEKLVSDVQTQIKKRTETEKNNSTEKEAAKETETEETLAPEMPVVEIDGYEYVGFISIPALELELPVMAEWDYPRLRIAPCRQFGSSRTDDLVIAAHNYTAHFGNLVYLESGDTVIFTDMDGIENRYEVVRIESLAPDEVEMVQSSGYDLVLYTCTYDCVTRVTVFCSRV